MKYLTLIAATTLPLLSACGGDPATPSQTPPATAVANSSSSSVSSQIVGSLVAAGTVYDATGAIMAGVSISYLAWSKSGFRSGTDTTDAGGRFTLTSLPAGTLQVMATKSGYLQPCATTVVIEPTTAVSISLARAGSFDTPTPDRPLFISAPEAYGEVYEVTASGRQPVAGANVELVDSEIFFSGQTRSDLAGRFYVCGYPAGTALSISKAGYDSVFVQSGFSTSGLSVQMRRR